MLDNWKPRSLVAGLLVASTLATAQQAAQPNIQDSQSKEGQPAPASVGSQLPSAPLSRPVSPFKMPDYSRGVEWFPNATRQYQKTLTPPTSFDNTPRIEQLIKGNTLNLSLSDAIALGLENNLDIAIFRYNYPIADTDILRARGGGALLGVATGTLQGTQGGGGAGSLFTTGTGAGGTTSGAGGAGSGTLGIVESTQFAGPTVPQLDPTITGNFQYDYAVTPQSNRLQGLPTTTGHTTTGDVAYNQGFLTGAILSVGFNNTRSSSNSTFNTLNPLLSSNFQARLTQPLLNGAGISNNNRFIRIAKNTRHITDLSFELQVISTVSQIEDIYWDLVNAYENVQVQQTAVAVAQRLLNDNKRQVEIGTLAPISVVQAQSQLATSNQNLIVAQTQLQLEQYLMLNAVARNVSNKELANVSIVPTDRMDLSSYLDENLNADRLTDLALKQNPILLISIVDLQNREISRKAARNALLPAVNFYAYYGASSIAGQQNPANTCGFAGVSTTLCTPAGIIPGGGFSNAFGDLFNSSAPDKGMGITLSIPIRNRVNTATQIRSELELQQAQLRLQQLKNIITVNIKSAVFSVQQDRAQVDAARSAREYAEQNLAAEQKKYQYGASTSYNVMTLQNALTQAEQTLLTAVTTYEKARVNLDLLTNQTLDRYNIDIGEALHGEVISPVKVPGVAPSTTQSNPQPNQATLPQAQPQPK